MKLKPGCYIDCTGLSQASINRLENALQQAGISPATRNEYCSFIYSTLYVARNNTYTYTSKPLNEVLELFRTHNLEPVKLSFDDIFVDSDNLTSTLEELVKKLQRHLLNGVRITVTKEKAIAEIKTSNNTYENADLRTLSLLDNANYTNR